MDRFCTEGWEIDLNHGNQLVRVWEYGSRRGSLRTIFVNSGGQHRVRLAQNHRQSTRKNRLCGSHDALNLPVHGLASRFFSAQRGEHETNYVAVNLQRSSTVNRSRGGFSSNQWLCCSTFRSHSHPSVQKLSALRLNYQISQSTIGTLRQGHSSGIVASCFRLFSVLGPAHRP